MKKKKKIKPIGYKICPDFSVERCECEKKKASNCTKKCIQPIFPKGKRGRRPYPDFVEKEIVFLTKKHKKWSLRKIAKRYVFFYNGRIKRLSHVTVAKILKKRGVKRKGKKKKSRR